MAKDNNLEFEVPIYIWRPPKLRGASLPVLEQTGLSIRDEKGNLLGVDWRGMVTGSQSGPTPKSRPEPPVDGLPHVHPDQIVAAASLAGIEELPTEPEKLNGLLQNPSHRLHKLRGILGNEEVDNLLKKLPEQFDFIVAQLAVVLKELSDTYNMSPGQSQLDAYEKARNRYLEFVEDLDARHLPKRAVNFQKKGYGKPIKWVDVLPAVEAGRIIGLRVVVRWNPHSSSSMIHF